MSRMPRESDRSIWSDRGAMLPIFATMMLVLIGMAAFAVDLGWFFVNATRVQRSAEAAALSGVVELPADLPAATTAAVDVARHNGYPIDLDTSVTVIPQPGGNETQLQVTITDTVDTFFTSIFGMNQVTITRSATAEYVPPLPLGAPVDQFGNSCDPDLSGCSGQPNFWANIHGRHTDTRMGDAYSSYCGDGEGSGDPSCDQNPSWRSTGYLYGIERGTAPGFQVEFIDLAHHNNSGSFDTDDDWRTGDRGCEDWGQSGDPAPSDPTCGMSMFVELFAPDATPLDLSDNTRLCFTTVLPQPQVDETDPYVPTTPDGQSCWRQDPALPGIYVVRVRVLDTGGDDDGLNRYTILADSLSGTPRLYGLGDMSLYNNASGSVTAFYLAEVEEFYRGRTFVVELYDPGESSSGGDIQIMEPAGVGSWNVTGGCEMYTRDEVTEGWTYEGTRTPCQFFAQSGSADDYNGRWIKLEVTLSDTYTCTVNCWWQMNYDYTGGLPNDTTTWKAYVIGAPVHLVPNP